MEESEQEKKRAASRKRSIFSKGKGPNKKLRTGTDNHKLKYPLGKSGSDPLNLEVWPSNDVCSTCPSSPSGVSRQLGDQPIGPLPQQLHHDPLNLEGKIDDFDSIMQGFNRATPLKRAGSCSTPSGKKKRKVTRSLSRSESSSNESQATTSSVTFNKKASVFRYGNYTQYYGYRNKGASPQEDPRLKLLKEEWFRGKNCLDIGSNTGLVTIAIAQKYAPRRILGVDIDTKLVRMAWKNLHRQFVPMLMPSGQPFPLSLKISHTPVNFGDKFEKDSFPNNVQFKQVDYVPKSDKELESIQPEYHVILCLSLTKWVHLNEGDEGLKRMFLKIYRQLLPSGLLLLEPQPWASYSKRKKLTPKIHENYQNISFKPEQFHSYLMSPAVGFSDHKYLGTSENSNPGFQRSVHLYIKHSAESAPPICAQTPPTTADNDQLDAIK